MLPYVLFDIAVFAEGDDPETARKDLLWFLEALTRRNQGYLLNHPDTPLLYKSGVTYEVPSQFDENSVDEIRVIRKAIKDNNIKDKEVIGALDSLQRMVGGERFRDIQRVLEKKRVDCDNLSAYRTAELRQHGIPADPYVTWRKRPDGGTTLHALVRWPDGSSEDPSLILGMGGAEREGDRQEERRKNAERWQEFSERVIPKIESGEIDLQEANKLKALFEC